MPLLENQRQNMIKSQLKANDINDPRLLLALKEIPRESFVPELFKTLAYMDQEIKLSENRYLLSPHTQAQLIQAANIKLNHRVLDIACGTGYTTILLSVMARKVFGLEVEASLIAQAEGNLSKFSVPNATIFNGNLIDGLPEESPFEAIIINGMVDFVPKSLLMQLAEGGTLVTITPCKNNLGYVTRYERTGTTFSKILLKEVTAPSLIEFREIKGFNF